MAEPLRPAVKLGIVVTGYAAAVATALLATRVYIAATSGVDRQTYSGMSAFGDSLVFLGALGVAAVPATGAALFFLRRHAGFWRGLSMGAVAIACTALLALVLSVGARSAGPQWLQPWSSLSPLRVLAAPLFAMFFLVCSLFAPTRSPRVRFLVASAVEIVVFVLVASTWWLSNR